jgi:hypothetical protein
MINDNASAVTNGYTTNVNNTVINGYRMNVSNTTTNVYARI